MPRSPLSRAMSSSGTTLPVPWKSLADMIEPEPGFLVNVLAAPGVGKSLLGIAWAYGIERPSLVISMDTDLRSQALRVVAMLRGLSVDEVKADPEPHSMWLAKQKYPVRWSDSPMVAEDLSDILEAEKEFGRLPQLVIVDTVGDLVEEEAYEEYVHAFVTMHKTAKKYKTVVMALHHLKRGSAYDGNKPVTLTDSLYSGDKQAEIVLGLWRKSQEEMRVGVLKNRMGAADRLGDFYAALKVDLARASIQEFDQIEQYKRQVHRG